jgi:ribonuclease P protein component
LGGYVKDRPLDGEETPAGPTGAGFDRERLPRKARIRRSTEIVGLHRSGTRRRRGPLDILVAESPGEFPRFGAVVPKHRHTIVERNRLRRRLREIGRREVLPGLRACGSRVDILVRARPEAYAASFAELRHALVRFTEELCSGVSHSV